MAVNAMAPVFGLDEEEDLKTSLIGLLTAITEQDLLRSMHDPIYAVECLYLEAERSAQDVKVELCTKMSHFTLTHAGTHNHVANEGEDATIIMMKISREIGELLASIKVDVEESEVLGDEATQEEKDAAAGQAGQAGAGPLARFTSCYGGNQAAKNSPFASLLRDPFKFIRWLRKQVHDLKNPLPEGEMHPELPKTTEKIRVITTAMVMKALYKIFNVEPEEAEEREAEMYDEIYGLVPEEAGEIFNAVVEEDDPDKGDAVDGENGEIEMTDNAMVVPKGEDSGDALGGDDSGGGDAGGDDSGGGMISMMSLKMPGNPVSLFIKPLKKAGSKLFEIIKKILVPKFAKALQSKLHFDDHKRRAIEDALIKYTTPTHVIKFIQVLSMAFSGVGAAFVPQAILSEVLQCYSTPIGETLAEKLAWFLAVAGKRAFHWDDEKTEEKKDMFLRVGEINMPQVVKLIGLLIDPNGCGQLQVIVLLGKLLLENVKHLKLTPEQEAELKSGITKMGIAAFRKGLGIGSAAAGKLKSLSFEDLGGCIGDGITSPTEGLINVLQNAPSLADIRDDPRFIKARNALIVRDLKMRAIMGETRARAAAFRALSGAASAEARERARAALAGASHFSVSVSVSVAIPDHVLDQLTIQYVESVAPLPPPYHPTTAAAAAAAAAVPSLPIHPPTYRIGTRLRTFRCRTSRRCFLRYLK